MGRLTRLLATSGTAVVAALALGTIGASPAAAGNVGGGVDGSGAFATASIKITVTGSSGRSSSFRRSVPATCWWEPLELGPEYGTPPVDPNDPASVEAYFEYISRFLSGHAAGGRLELPDGDYMKDIARRVAAGEKLTFYYADCVDGKSPVGEGLIPKSGSWQGVDFGVRFRAFPNADAVPGPVVPAAALADLARAELTFDDPAVDYNPKIRDGGLATLVGLPTWFWVVNKAAALGSGDDNGGIGHASVTAEAGRPGTADPRSSATVESTNEGMTVSAEGLADSPLTCDLDQITKGYGSGATDATACQSKFTHASVNSPRGFGVTVTTKFKVTWHGVEANGAQVGPLGLNLINNPQALLNVPVAESQAIVGQAG